MVAVRGRADRNAVDFRTAAARSKDWTSYVRSAPLACAAGAAVAGYLLVPARRSKPKVVVKKAGGKSGSAPAPVERPVKGKGPWMGVLSVLGNVAVRAGTAYVSQRAGSFMGGTAAETANEADPQPSAAPEPPRTGRSGFGGPR